MAETTAAKPPPPTTPPRPVLPPIKPGKGFFVWDLVSFTNRDAAEPDIKVFSLDTTIPEASLSLADRSGSFDITLHPFTDAEGGTRYAAYFAPTEAFDAFPAGISNVLVVATFSGGTRNVVAFAIDNTAESGSPTA